MATLIAIDGLDGSGKENQTRLLVNRLKIENYSVRTLNFPMLEAETSGMVRMYMDGKFGNRPSDVNPYAASTILACERYASYKADWNDDYNKLDKIIVSNTYSTANIIHQLSRLPKEEWDSFVNWVWDLEFIKLGLPTPDVVIYLDMPVGLIISQIKQCISESEHPTEMQRVDEAYLQRCHEAANFACDKLNWERISCYNDEGIRSREAITGEIAELISERTDIVL